MSIGQHKAVTVEPVRILGIKAVTGISKALRYGGSHFVLHEFVEQDVGGWGQAHRGSGMAGVGLEGRIDLDIASINTGDQIILV